jgi:hypothetical protein
MIGFGHQWKLVRDWICSGCSTKATHCWAILFQLTLSRIIRKPSLFVRHCCLPIEIIAMALHFLRLSPLSALIDRDVFDPMAEGFGVEG